MENPAVEILLRERELLSDQAKALRGKIKALDEAITQLRGDALPAHGASQKSRPRLNDRVLMVLSEMEDGGTPQSIADHLTANGRETGNTTVSSLLSRMKKSGDVEKRQNGRWYVVGSKEPPEGGSSSANHEEGEVSPDQVPKNTTLVLSTPRASRLRGGTHLASSGSIQFPLGREKGG